MKPKLVVATLSALFVTALYADGWDPATKAGNVNSISNTRHNLTMSYLGNASIMDGFRNQYFEVCVYCHTPHGANTQMNAPLWNKRRSTRNYEVYNEVFDVRAGEYAKPTVYDQPVNNPGPNSLTCLSCHDGSMSVDTVLNMPTQPTGVYAGYSPSPNKSFLDQWNYNGNNNHAHLREISSGSTFACQACHNGSSSFIPDFSGFQIAEGDNLRNDHPIGVTYPAVNIQPNPSEPAFQNVEADYNSENLMMTSDSLGRETYFFDTNGNGKLEKDEIRLYNSGDGPRIECATCHDPHGVPVNGKGTEFIPSFLRVSNSPQVVGEQKKTLCLTCHNK